jgi:hypothetical protein
VNIEPGAPLAPLAEYHDAHGWQLVPCAWHVAPKTKRKDTTPISDVTGRTAPFLTGDQILAKVRRLVLHPEGGPECTGRNAKPAIRPPLHVVGIDVDHGYDSRSGMRKTGGDTLVNAEMALGPLPGTWSLTARGPWQPSRRLWFRIPPDLVLLDEFFTEYGGDIEVLRTHHRYSWTWPAIHTKRGQIVGPVLWYDANHNVVPLPHVDDLPELPAAWGRRGYELMKARAERERQRGPLGACTTITARHADAIIAKQVRRFMEPDCRGGDFRSVLFGLTASITRRALARGHGETEVREELRELFATHSWRGTPNDRDVMWISDGLTAGRAEPWEFKLEMFNPDGTLTDEAIAILWETYPPECSAGGANLRDGLLDTGRPVVPAAATGDELDTWLASFTRYTSPARLYRRMEWMTKGKLPTHARALVDDTLNGDYPASLALRELTAACQKRGHLDPATPRTLLAVALGAALDAKAVTQ